MDGKLITFVFIPAPDQGNPTNKKQRTGSIVDGIEFLRQVAGYLQRAGKGNTKNGSEIRVLSYADIAIMHTCHCTSET